MVEIPDWAVEWLVECSLWGLVALDLSSGCPAVDAAARIVDTGEIQTHLASI